MAKTPTWKGSASRGRPGGVGLVLCTLLFFVTSILKNGQIANPEEIQFYGYWSWERMSELMPIDYDAKSDN